MKLIVVKCPKNKKVQVEDRGTSGAICPDNCPMKQSSRCFNKTFRYLKPLPASVLPDIPYCAGSVSVEAVPPVNDTKAPVSSFNKASVSPTPSYQPAKAAPIFEESVDDGDYLPNDAFGAFGGFDNGESFSSYTAAEEKPASASKSNKLDKYNDFLVDDNSIFSAVRARREDEACFVDGAYEFYEKAPSSVRSAGNSKMRAL